MSNPVAVVVGIGTALAVTLLASLAPWHVVPNPIYLIPIAAFLCCAQRHAALWVGVGGLFGFTVDLLSHATPGKPWLNTASPVVIQAVATGGIVLLTDGVRRLAVTCRRGAAAENVEEDASRSRATMRRIDCTGAPRPRSNMDQGNH